MVSCQWLVGSEEECIKGLNKERIETPIVMDKPVCYPFGWEFYRTGFTIAVINHFVNCCALVRIPLIPFRYFRSKNLVSFHDGFRVLHYEVT